MGTAQSLAKNISESSEQIIFDVNTTQLNEISQSRTEDLIISLPIPGQGNKKIQLEERSILSEYFNVTEIVGGNHHNISYQAGKFYMGEVVDEVNSKVHLTFFDSELAGTIYLDGQTFNLGKKPESKYHNIHKVNPQDQTLKCSTDTEGFIPPHQTITRSSSSCSTVVEVYFECDYQMYLNHGSNTTTVSNYVTSMFNEVAAIYTAESISVVISQISVWTTNDGYPSGVAGLTAFANAKNQNGFTGDLAHLLTNDTGSNGGVAYLNQLCGNSPYAYSDITNSFSAYPTYSWDVQVVSHEFGHNFGSPHTHDCSWGPNNNSQIDDCGNLALGSGGSCYNSSSPIIPSGGGTVMSYCHLNSVGINFNSGFGSEPGDLIRLNHGNCFCDNATCDTAQEILASGSFSAQPNSGHGASQSNATHADWFKFTPVQNGLIDISSCNQGVDSRFIVHNGTACNSLTFVRLQDDDCTSQGNNQYAASLTGLSVVGGQTYYIEWDNRWSTAQFTWQFTYTATGNAPLDITCPSDVVDLNNCSSDDYDPTKTGFATTTESNATITFSDNLSSTTCSIILDREWTVTDANGDTNNCYQVIDLLDEASPNITFCPGNIVVTSEANCQAIVTWNEPTAEDNCTTTTSTSNYSSGDIFDLGIYNITYNLMDQCSNVSTCTFNVTVEDGCVIPHGPSDCDNDNLLVTGMILDTTYRASIELDSDGIIFGGTNAIMSAGQSMEFKPGFELQVGGTLSANIEDCDNN